MTTTAAHELLAQVLSHGVTLRAEDDVLHYRPKRALPPELVDQLRARKAEVLALLRTEEVAIAWRLQAMLPQIPARGPIPFLYARPELRDQWRELGHTRCHSCGEALPPEHVVQIVPRCSPCQRATEAACNASREGVRGPAP
jgi:hypothetical protein